MKVHNIGVFKTEAFHLFLFSSVQSLSRVRLFATPWTAAHQASLSVTNSWNLLKLMSIETVITIQQSQSSVIPFSSCLQSFPASGPFLMSQLFASGDQSSGASASASVLPVNIQGCFPNSPWWFIWEVTSLGTGEREGGRKVRQKCSH